MEEKRIALLIDSDNVSADYIDIILDSVCSTSNKLARNH